MTGERRTLGAGFQEASGDEQTTCQGISQGVPGASRGASLTLALEALTGANDRSAADAQGAREIGQGGQLVKGAVCEAAVTGAEVVDAMGGEGKGEGGVGDLVPVEEEAEIMVDGDRVDRLEIDGLGETGGTRGRNPALRSGSIDWPATSSQFDSGSSKNGASA